MKRLVVCLVLSIAWVASSQPAPDATPPAPDEPGLNPTRADHATCLVLDTTPGALLETDSAAQPNQLATPIPWNDFAVDGTFIRGDTKETLHAIFEPTFNEHRTNFTDGTWREVAALSAKFGYQLVGHLVQPQPDGARLLVSVAPLPLVRRVATIVDSDSRLFGLFDKLVDDEVGRRLRVRPGSYLPWEPIRRQCAIMDERERVEGYLHDEGYADATVQIAAPINDDSSVDIRLRVDLGKQYNAGRITIVTPPGETLAVPRAQIEAFFRHRDNCFLVGCFTTARFTRTRHQEDLQAVRNLFHQRGYPTVRVSSSFDPTISFDRRTHTVNFTITIDQRRLIDVSFDGNDKDAVPDGDLRKQLTFDASGSSDDVEAQTSARALVSFLQGRGYFDARVTFDRTRLTDQADRLAFHIDAGPSREVGSVEFVGAHVMPEAKLRETIATKESSFRVSFISGDATATTSAQLDEDIQRITELYRRAGYRDAHVTAVASTTREGLASAAMTATDVLADRGHDLFVRFVIDEGQATLISRVEIAIQASDPAKKAEICALVLRELATELNDPQFGKHAPDAECAANITNYAFREDDVAATRDHVRDYLYRTGRPRAIVEYETKAIGAHSLAAHYKITSTDELRIGKVAIRGNFKTHDSVIRDELRLKEGALLTSDALANGARRLRNTGLFDAVNIELPDLCGPLSTSATTSCASTTTVVNAVVRVEERYDNTATVDVLGGYSSYNGLFGGAGFAMRNIRGYGLVWTVNTTIGTKITELESSFQIPKWLDPNWIPDSFHFRTELTGLYRQQDTPRFGLLTTEGASLALTQQWPRQKSGDTPARVLTWNMFRYDFRLRTREVDALRPIGTNQDNAQVGVSTRTSSVGMTFDWEQRVDRNGVLNPLSPERGFRFEASAAYAESFLLGQDSFVKLSATGSKYQLVGDNLVLRADLRVDWGIPLGGAVLLPEVERFFAGGDSTVRGYSDDRMATELIQVGVPPLGSGLSQIRIIPAGGNIRAIGSLDAQLRIYKILAGALFSDAGMITNEWNGTTYADFKPSVGMGLRVITPFGIGALEYAIPLRPQLGDDPRGRIHFYFAARAQF